MTAPVAGSAVRVWIPNSDALAVPPMVSVAVGLLDVSVMLPFAVLTDPVTPVRP